MCALVDASNGMSYLEEFLETPLLQLIVPSNMLDNRIRQYALNLAASESDQ